MSNAFQEKHDPCAAKDAVWVEAGLPDVIDIVAEQCAASHQFLRRQWFAAAEKAYPGSNMRTLIAVRGDSPVVTMPISAKGPSWLKAAAVPGSYWPFRSFPVAEGVGAEEGDALLALLAREVRLLRMGPIYDGDPALEWLKAAAKRQGWSLVQRVIGQAYLLGLNAQQDSKPWPRSSTLKRNRFHEKQMAEEGALQWEAWEDGVWSAARFADLAAIEAQSWVNSRAEGRDAKFLAQGHAAFWQAAATDPKLAAMFQAAVLRVDGRPSAFSFDMDLGALKYVIANSYDERLARYSPGKLLAYRNLMRARDSGMTRVDWGGGDSGYKRVVGAEPGPIIRDWLFIRPGNKLLASLVRAMWKTRAER